MGVRPDPIEAIRATAPSPNAIRALVCSARFARLLSMLCARAATVRSRLAASARIACAVCPKRRASAVLVRSASTSKIAINAGGTHSPATKLTSAGGVSVAKLSRDNHSIAPIHPSDASIPKIGSHGTDRDGSSSSIASVSSMGSSGMGANSAIATASSASASAGGAALCGRRSMMREPPFIMLVYHESRQFKANSETLS
ncbi:MAG: hypothetical protein ACOY4B_01510 [Pseudomonadota bacterium]